MYSYERIIEMINSCKTVVELSEVLVDAKESVTMLTVVQVASLAPIVYAKCQEFKPLGTPYPLGGMPQYHQGSNDSPAVVGESFKSFDFQIPDAHNYKTSLDSFRGIKNNSDLLVALYNQKLNT